MNFVNTFIVLALSCYLISLSRAKSSQYFRRLQKYCPDHDSRVGWSQPYQNNKFLKRQSEMMSDGDSDGDSDSDSDDSSNSTSMMTTLKGLINKIPQTNFYSSIPNAVGVVGQGLSVLDKIGISLGTPLPYWIGTLPLCLFGIALVFIPDLTTLNLPGFYPSGAGEGDPLAAFPPRPNLDFLPDIDLSLSPDNIPPRIILPKSTPPPQEVLLDDHSVSSSPLPSITMMQQEEVDDSPTNPESFQAPRRRLGVGTNGSVQQNLPPQFHPQQHNHNYVHYGQPGNRKPH